MWLSTSVACSCLTCHFAAEWLALKSSKFPPAAFAVLATLAGWVAAFTEKCAAVAVVAQRKPERGAVDRVISAGFDDSCLLYQPDNSYAVSTYSVSESLKYCLRLDPSDCHSWGPFFKEDLSGDGAVKWSQWSQCLLDTCEPRVHGTRISGITPFWRLL